MAESAKDIRSHSLGLFVLAPPESPSAQTQTQTQTQTLATVSVIGN
jgi:hypothetical protein